MYFVEQGISLTEKGVVLIMEEIDSMDNLLSGADKEVGMSEDLTA